MPEKLLNRRRLSERPEPPPRLPSSSKNAPAAGGKNVDHDLFKNLVEMVPLVESLMDRKANPSLKRRASMVYTAAPKVLDPKGKKTAQAVSATKQMDRRDNANASFGHDQNQDSAADTFSMFSSRAMKEEDFGKDTEELIMLREKLDDLHRILSEKDGELKSAEELMKQMGTVHVTLDELRRRVAEREFIVTSTSSQLSNAETKLEERQAALDKLECEASKANIKVKELQCDLESMDFEKSSLMLLFQELSRNDSVAYSEDNITSFQKFDHLSHRDSSTDADAKQMEEARVAYIAALAVAKENPSIESLAVAAEARLKLEAFVV